MSTKLSVRTAVALALASAAAMPVSTYAQEAPGTNNRSTEEVVVTGSLIRGTPEDTALPVEVFTAEDLENQGDPSPLEFVKSLSISGPTTGEAYYFSGSANTNSVRFNLRGIGDDKTLTLFNGRRAFQNSVVYPSGAIENIEILKDGAAVTYGADATGGVVNVITRKNFEGFETSASYKTYDGSDEGEWKVGAVAGFNTDNSNLLFAVEWDHRSELHSYDRDFARQPYWVNPAPNSNLTNLAGWIPRTDRPATPTAPTAAGEFGRSQLFPLPSVGLPEGSPRADFTQETCEAVGGIYENSFRCHYNYIPYYNLVEENDVHRVFAQFNTQISDNSEFTLRALWARNSSPHQYGSPSQPVIRGPARATGATNQLYVPIANPHAQEFAQRSGWVNARDPVTGALLYPDTEGFTPFTYRAFAHGGNAAMASGDNYSTPNSNETKYFHVTADLSGDITESIGYNIAATFNQTRSVNSQPDILGFRLQDALNGYGGPNCAAVDTDLNTPGMQGSVAPGTNGCQWYNPFATNFAGQPTFGYANPVYDPADANSPELIRWLFNKREFEDNNWNFTFDAVFSGETPIELPGGNLAWGAGAQYRTIENRQFVEDPLYNGQTPCDWPGQNPDPRPSNHPEFNGCTADAAGPYLFFANNVPDASDQKQQSYFVEINLPILDTLNVSAAGRYEQFDPIDLDATVYKVSAKWQVIDQFALRGSYGTNYQAPGIDATGRAIIPGDLFNTVASYTRAGGAWLGSQEFTRDDIEPETATVWNVGAIAQLDWGTDQDLQVILDYFSIETENELGQVASTSAIADSVFAATGARLADCSHPLINRVTFNGGLGCIQGTSSATNFSSIRTDYGNGPGQLVTGFDLQLNYGIGIGPGRLSLGTTITKYQKNETTETVLDGFVVKEPDDRLGYLNFATVGASAPEWRGNAFANYNFGDHNVRMQVNYVSGVDDERFLNEDGSINEAAAGLTPAGFQPGTTTRFGPTYFGIYGDDWVSADLHYLWRAPWATLGLSVINVADEEPPASRQEMGYDPRIGSPLGRQFELTIKKEF